MKWKGTGRERKQDAEGEVEKEIRKNTKCVSAISWTLIRGRFSARVVFGLSTDMVSYGTDTVSYGTDTVCYGSSGESGFQDCVVYYLLPPTLVYFAVLQSGRFSYTVQPLGLLSVNCFRHSADLPMSSV